MVLAVRSQCLMLRVVRAELEASSSVTKCPRAPNPNLCHSAASQEPPDPRGSVMAQQHSQACRPQSVLRGWAGKEPPAASTPVSWSGHPNSP